MPTKCSIVERQKGKDLGCDPALYSSSCMLCRLDYEMVETFSIEQPSELSRSAQCPQNDTPPLSLARIQRVGGTPNKERGDGSARQPIDTRTDSSARGAPSILTMAKIAGCSKHKALSTVLVQLLTSLFVDALEANKQQICRIVMGCYRGLVVLPWVLTGLMCGTTLAQGTSVVTEAAAQALLRETQEFLVGGHAALEDDSQLSGAMEDIQREIESLHAVQQDLERKEREIDRLVALANAKQVEGLIARLSETLSKEMALRSLTGQSGEGMATADVVTAEYVDRQELQEQLGAQRFLAASEFVISDWVRQILKAELKEYKTSMLELANNSAVSSRSSTGEGCAAVTDVVQDIQVALTKFSQDVIGLVDHAQGAEIVHTMTSPTYVPPPTENELLGNVWWSKFIPEDWERLLPEGWEDWDIRIPSFFFHSLNPKGANTSPPESILEKKVLPGACWPMDGDRGQVTIRLPYSIKAESFSLDHVSWDIVPDNMHETAPKKLKVIAYPPCPEPDECGALGFDATDPMEIAHLNYDVDGPMVQTFNSVFVPLTGASSTGDEDEEDDDEGDGEFAAELEDKEDATSCSQEAAACSTPPKIDVAAITVKILENHGNADYTCMYRFRVHGEQVL